MSLYLVNRRELFVPLLFRLPGRPRSGILRQKTACR
jgi:hypothetical protein